MRPQEIRIISGEREEVIEDVNNLLSSLEYNGCDVLRVEHQSVDLTLYSVMVHFRGAID